MDLGSYILECLMGFVPGLHHPSIFLFLTELYMPSSFTDPIMFRPPFHTFLQAPLPLGRLFISFLWNSCYGMEAEMPHEELTSGRMREGWKTAGMNFLQSRYQTHPILEKIQNYQCIKMEADLSVLLTAENKRLNYHINYGFQGCICLLHCVQIRH